MTPDLLRRAAPLTLVVVAFGVAALAPLTSGCDDSSNEYKAKPNPSGRAANLPAVPTLPQTPKRDGDAYTVFGAIHDLRSRISGPKLRGKEITIVGYITKTNLDEAPPCAVHKTGKADGKECETNPPPVPAFWIGTDKGAPENQSIKVMGFASNYAKLFDALQKFKTPNNKDAAKDETWNVEIPNPLPAKDAKVRVTGVYATTFDRASQSIESDPINGIVTYKTMTYLEPPPTPGGLPGVK